MAQSGALWLEWDERGVARRIAVDRAITIGRVPGNDIEVDDQAVSRRHCVITPGQDCVMVDARQSTNLVESGGQQLATLQLRCGEAFTVGPMRFEVSAGEMTGVDALAGPLALQWRDASGSHQLAVAGPLRIGRVPGNDIVLENPKVSRTHAVVTPAGSALHIDATGSRNGISSGGRQAERLSVQRGGQFAIGDTQFQVAQAARNRRAGARQPQGTSRRPSPAMFGALAAAACLAVIVVVVGLVPALGGGDKKAAGLLAQKSVSAAEGGVVEAPNGPRVIFPAGALDKDSMVTIKLATNAPRSDNGVSPAYEISAGDARLTGGRATIEIPFDATKVGSDVNSDAVALAYSETGEPWKTVYSSIDLNRGVAVYESDHFSAWQVQNSKSGAVAVFAMPYSGTDTSVKYVGGPHAQASPPAQYCPGALSHASGIDFGAGGTSFRVLAIAAGRVVDIHLSGTEISGAGYWVTIEHAGGLQSSYWHLQKDRPDHDATHPELTFPPMNVGDFVPQGFPIGNAGKSGQGPNGVIHAHIELETGHVEGQAYRGAPVSWNGRAMGGWTFWQHASSADPAKGYAYQGSATKGRSKQAEILIKNTTGAGCNKGTELKVNARVSAAFDDNQKTNTSDDCALTIDANTAFACSSGSHLPSANCERTTATEVCSADHKPTDAPLPGGDWVQAPVNNENVSKRTLDLVAHATAAAGAPPVKFVNFTLWWPGFGEAGGPWRVACATFIFGKDNTYKCTLDLDAERVPVGPFKISFDVWDESGRVRKAPGGVRSLTHTSTPDPSVPPKDRDGDGVSDGADNCPDIPGPASNDGCPATPKPSDRDGDGVPDATDSCPTVAGPASNKGCPTTPKPSDLDGDGVVDGEDSCPDIYGPASNKGCPITPNPDSDGDGVPDSSDRCPTKRGPANNNGCPITPVPEQPASVRVWTDKTTYTIGEAISVCYSVSRSGHIRLIDYQTDGVTKVVINDVDDGTGGCLGGSVSGPAGTERLEITFLGASGNVLGQNQATFVIRDPQPTLEEYNRYVPGNVPWWDTGIDLRSGDTVTFSASGLVKIWLTDTGHSPGSNDCRWPLNIMIAPGLPCYGLVGKVGASGTPLFIGAARTAQPGAGRLYLSVNDDWFSDNVGGFTVQISIVRAR